MAKVWLENDGDGAAQEAAALRAGGEGWEVVMLPDGRALRHLPGKSGPERAPAACRDGAILVLNQPWKAPPPSQRDEPCTVLDPEALRETGAVALLAAGDGVRLVTARERSGHRLWNDEEVRRAALGGMMAGPWPGRALAAPQ